MEHIEDEQNLSFSSVKNSKLFIQKTSLVAGFILFVIMLSLPAPKGLSPAGWKTAAIGILMAIYWITEAIPIPATSLIPMVFLPIFNIGSIKESTAPYANPLIFLFMGGFIIALGMQRWKLHLRIALSIIRFVGMRPKALIAGFMISTAFLSMWVSNTATTLMMLPIGLSIIELAQSANVKENDQDFASFKTALMLSIAFAASIGGLGTLIGTPPNALLAGFMEENYNIHILFGQWMMIGVPIVVLGLPLAYLTLTRIVFPIHIEKLPGGEEYIHSELEKLGPITKAEKWVAIVFILVAFSWMLRPLIVKLLPGVSDTGIAVAGALVMFAIPVDWKNGVFLMTWKEAERLPWGVLILFGGGLSLASAITRTGLSVWIGTRLALFSHLPVIVVVVILATVIILLTELTSNTATTAAFLPVVASVAVSSGQNPLLLVIPATIAASCAFMLPVATPPNAIVYGSGSVTISQMLRAGIVLDALFLVLVVGLTFGLGLFVFHIHIGLVPAWVPTP
ncbi:MAG: DASS family sodium-coupled anion symporter [Calditrichaeota bacterium]|nr:DASS family sodium-coupled anion symporter [Calditrichota bacterium]